MPIKKKIRPNFENSSKMYFKEINAYSPLTKDEEINLWEKYKKYNDLSARDKLVKSNLRFVASIAKEYQGLGLSYPDLISEGNIGLLKSFEKYDYTKGFKTISYSVWWIKQSILEALHKRNLLKGDDLPLDYEKQEDDDDKTNHLIDMAFIDNQYEKELTEKDNLHMINLLMTDLNKREKLVVEYYFGLDNNDEHTLEEIGDILGLTKERIRQIKCSAFKKMRSMALSFQMDTIY